MIRDATLKDISELMEFLHPFHDEGGYRDINIDRTTVAKNLQIMLSSPMHKIWVVERDGQLSCGSPKGTTQQTSFYVPTTRAGVLLDFS